MAREGVSVFGSLFSRLRLFADVSVGGSCATAGDSLAPLELSAMVGDFPQCVALEFGLKTRFRVKPPTVIGSLLYVGTAQTTRVPCCTAEKQYSCLVLLVEQVW
jgi:hypothetical protein